MTSIISDNELLSIARLQMAVQNPNTVDAWNEGYQCAQDGIEEHDNPHLAGSEAAQKWSDGWWAGIYDEEPLDAEAEIESESWVEPPVAEVRLPIQETHEDEAWISSQVRPWSAHAGQVLGALFTVLVVYQVLDLTVI